MLKIENTQFNINDTFFIRNAWKNQISRDANSKLSIYKQDAIELHWANNEHHPEHWKDINEMPMGARREFVCDCCARSLQYGTNFLEFMQKRLEDRFTFNDIIKDEILYTCKIVINLMNEK